MPALREEYIDKGKIRRGLWIQKRRQEVRGTGMNNEHLRTEYKYIKFVKIISTGKTVRFSCINIHHGEELGEIKWYGAWRQYCYFANVSAVYSKGCLDDISDFLNQLKTHHNINH